MKQMLSLLSVAILALGLAGCSATQTATTTNETVNTNGDTVLTNTDPNTNTEQGNDVNTNASAGNSNTDVNADTTDVNTDSTDDTTVDTSDWLTYTNEEYGFSFRYPSEWILGVLQEGGLGIDAGDIRIQNDICEVFITVPHEKDDQAKVVGMYNEALSTGSFGGELVKKVLLGSIQAIQYLNPKFAYESKGEIYKFVINDKLFSATFGYDPGDESCAGISETILMTMQLDS